MSPFSRPVAMLVALTAFTVAGCITAPPVSAETLQLAVPRAVVYDAGGAPQFAGGQDYILSVAGNPDGAIHASTADMVRVSSDGSPELWIRCSDLQTRVGQCAAAASASAAPPMMTRTLPICPGDPRCPRPKKK